jgi:hypothetical protein
LTPIKKSTYQKEHLSKRAPIKKRTRVFYAGAEQKKTKNRGRGGKGSNL